MARERYESGGSTTIDWRAARQNLIWREFYKGCTPPHSDFFIKDPHLTNDKAYKHFRQTFLRRLDEFAQSRLRAALAVYKEPAEDDNLLFSNEVRYYPEKKFGLGPQDEYYNGCCSISYNPFSTTSQKWSSWKVSGTDYAMDSMYKADCLKMLITIAAFAQTEDPEIGENALNAILVLAKHPESTPIGDLLHLGCGHSFGIQRLTGVTMSIYCMMSLLVSVEADSTKVNSIYHRPTNLSPYNCETLYRLLIDEVFHDFDGPMQNVPHIHFWKKYSINSETHDRLLELRSTFTNERLVPQEYELDRVELKHYLKRCFAILVVSKIYTDLAITRQSWLKHYWREEITWGTYRKWDHWLEEQDDDEEEEEEEEEAAVEEQQEEVEEQQQTEQEARQAAEVHQSSSSSARGFDSTFDGSESTLRTSN